MADYRVTDTQLSSIANAIRTKGGTSASLVFPSGFVSAVENIPTGGGVLISKTISQNGSYRAADDNADGYSDVIVNVSGGSSPVLISKSISQNGTYNPSDDNADAYSQVVVNVSGGGGGLPDIVVTREAGSISNDGVTTIGTYAFYSYSGLSGIRMGKVTHIKESAFVGCNNLSEAIFPKCESIGRYAFQNCSNLQTISFPECVTIGQSAFAYCKSLTTVSFLKCTNVNASAFQGCKSLSEAYLPACEKIERLAFNSCANLRSISLPLCSAISDGALQGCSVLSEVFLLSESIVYMQNSEVFQNTPIKYSSYLGYFGSIYVPASLVEAYKSASKWSYYSDRITSYVEE